MANEWRGRRREWRKCGGVVKNVPVADMQSAMVRSSRIDKARGKRMVNPRWYKSVVVISAALTLMMNELKPSTISNSS